MYKQSEIKKVNKIFRSLGNERRLRILSLLLKEGPMSVSNVSEKINLSLNRAGFISGRQYGLNRIYEIEEEIRKILTFFFKSFT